MEGARAASGTPGNSSRNSPHPEGPGIPKTRTSEESRRALLADRAPRNAAGKLFLSQIQRSVACHEQCLLRSLPLLQHPFLTASRLASTAATRGASSKPATAPR